MGNTATALTKLGRVRRRYPMSPQEQLARETAISGPGGRVILRDFPDGTYSAQINGANGETRTAIVELYVVP
jgi:hypothetical protein